MSDANRTQIARSVDSSLRDRIAAVLDKHHPIINSYNDEPSDWCQCGLPRDHVADAVIEALKLKREETLHSLLPDYDRNVVRANVWTTRYVTEWTEE